MKTIVQHELYGQITSDDETDRVTAGRGDLAKRTTESSLKALPERLCIRIGGYFGPCYEVKLKKGRLTYTYWPPRESYSQEPVPQTEEIHPSAKQWQTFRKSLDRLNVWSWKSDYPIPWSAMEPGGPLKSLTRIDRSYLPAITAFRGGMEERFPFTADETDNTFAEFCRAVARLVGREFQ